MSYYSLQQAIDLFQKDLPEPSLPFDLPQLADLCRQGILTPVFPYQGFISVPVDNGRPIHATGAIEPYDSYLYSNELIKLIDGYADKLELWTASTPQGLHNLYFYSRPMRHTDDDIDPITFMVRLENILFAADDVQNYITLQYFGDLTTPEQQRIAELESQLAQAHADNEQLRRQHSLPADDDKELEANTQAAVTRLLNVLFHMSGHDLSAHSGTLNKNIYDYSRHPSIETPITKVFISDWIKRVQQLRLDTKEKKNTGAYDRHVT